VLSSCSSRHSRHLIDSSPMMKLVRGVFDIPRDSPGRDLAANAQLESLEAGQTDDWG